MYGDGVNIAARLEGLAEPAGVTMSESIRTAVKGKVDAEFEDQGEQQVKNIPDPVRAYAVKAVVDTLLTVTGVEVSKPVTGFGSRPAIAVLPFANLTGDPDQEYFADGLAEDILTRLAMQRWLPVIARNSSFAYRGRTIDVKAVGPMLGARYVLRASEKTAESDADGNCVAHPQTRPHREQNLSRALPPDRKPSCTLPIRFGILNGLVLPRRTRRHHRLAFAKSQLLEQGELNPPCQAVATGIPPAATGKELSTDVMHFGTSARYFVHCLITDLRWSAPASVLGTEKPERSDRS